jgi:hypothetical protein
MGLKYFVTDLTSVPEPFRSEYVKAEAGYHLDVKDHPDTTRVAEFRATNVTVMKEKTDIAAKLAAFDGLDPVAAKAALAKVAAGDSDDVVKLKLKLAEAESTAASATMERQALKFRQLVSSEFLAAGGRPAAVDLILPTVPFALVDEELKPKDGEKSPNLTEWIQDQAANPEKSFLFLPSAGGGARGAKAPSLNVGVRSNVKQLVDPTPQQLGEHAADIKAGRVKVAYSNS